MRAIIDALELYPRTCVWEITARCNYRCLHCASDLGPNRSRGRELSSDRALRLCDELASLGCEYAVLSGGEPLLRADWPALAKHLHERGISVGMISNGAHVNKRAISKMIQSHLSVLAISVDGSENTHDEIRRHRGAHKSAIEALFRAREAGLRTHVVTHVNRLNRGDLNSMLHELEFLRVNTWLIQLSAPMGRLREHQNLIMAPADIPALARWLIRARASSSVNISVGDNIGYYAQLEGALRQRNDGMSLGFWCGCSAGCFTLGIEANGNVKGCLSLQSDEFVEGNLGQEDLRTIWEHPESFSYTRKFTLSNLSGHCAGCEYGEVCRGGCTFMAVASTGHIGDNPYCMHSLKRAL